MYRLLKNITLLAAATLLPLPALSPDAKADNVSNADEAWTIHGSFDNRPRKIFDTPEATYFFVHTKPFFRTGKNNYFVNPGGALFYIDKKNPEAGIQDFFKSVRPSGYNIRQLEVDPATGFIAVAYTDGGIDLITPDKKVIYFSDLIASHNYGAGMINSLSFDPVSHDLWVSHNGGFLKIDHNTLQSDLSAEWSEAVTDIIPVGDYYIAIIASKIFLANADADITRRSSFSEIASVTSGAPLRLMSIGPDTFIYTSSNGTIQKVCINNGKWARYQLINNSKYLQADANSVINRAEHTVTQTATGYLVTATDKFYRFDRIEEAGQGTSVNAITINAPANATIYAGSYDLENFWYYRERGEFVSCRYADNAWGTVSDPMRPEAPLTCMDSKFLYSPEYGFLHVNMSPMLKASIAEVIQPILVSSYKNGKWKNLSPVYNPPYFTDDNPAALTEFKNKSGSYPGQDPSGVVIDPLYPNVLHLTGTWTGFTSIYLDDPRRASIPFVTENISYTNLPHKKIFPRPVWSTFAGTTLLGADDDGIIWVARAGLTNPGTNTYYLLWGWTPEARAEALETSDIDKAGDWTKIEFDTGVRVESYISGHLLKHPKNKNKFVTGGQVNDGIDRLFRVYDHNGTIDDLSDDKLENVHFVRCKNGKIGNINYATDHLEDPVTGDILFFTGTDIFVIDLTKPIDNYTIDGDVLSITSGDDNSFAPLGPIDAFVGCFDEYNRLWIGTKNKGVIGLNADRTKVIGHYTAENSPLPSNVILGIGWNPDTQSLFISTEVALAEVNVDAPEVQGAALTPFVTPNEVNPEYSGTIAIHNVPDGVSLVVRDADGNIVASLNDINDGITHWNLLDNNGNHVSSGRYSICDASTTPVFPEVYLNVVH